MSTAQDDSLTQYTTRRLKSAGSAVIDTLLPPQELLGLDADPIAKRMWADVSFLDAPWCEACGFPFEYAVQSGSLCARCSTKRPDFDRARAPMAYDDGSRALILSFKHGGRTEGLASFAAQMRRAGRDVLSDADLLVPVPLHSTRLIKRRYNQAALLARALAKITPARFAPDILFRTRRTESQGGFNARARAENVRGAFSVKRLNEIKDRNLVLIDDVLTTGATLEACARTLKKAGAARVDGICLARVAKAAALPT
ncbi:MAG: ComF family protein [Litorimonas sp.]